MKCWTRDCKNEAKAGRHYCGSCSTRKYREKYPLKYIFDTIRMNAKRRGKVFTLTFSQFKAFCEETGYYKFKGKTAESLSIDRKNPNLGYTIDNIQAITLKDNTLKQLDQDKEFILRDNCPY